MHWKTRLFIAICLTSFAAQALAPWVNLRHAVQSWLGQPKSQERPRWRKKPKKPEVIPFVESTQCSTWLRSVGDTIVYNYSPYKPHPTADALRSCILSDEAFEVRTTIKELLIAIPVSGDAELLQEPLLDIVKALPNLERVRWPSWGRQSSLSQVMFSDWAGRNKLPATRDAYPFNADYSPAEYENWHHFIDCTMPDLDVYVSYGTFISDSLLTRLYETLTTCSTIRSLKLSIRQGGSTVDPGNPFSFDWRHGDVFPPLANLTLLGYDWAITDGGQISDPWINRMDWSQLRQLEIDLPSEVLLNALNGKLPNLESLTIRPKWGVRRDDRTLCESGKKLESIHRSYLDFISELPSLRELTISGLGSLLNYTKILQRHGQRLTQLGFHDFEADCGSAYSNRSWIRPTFSATEIEEIGGLAPHLKHLILDVNRTPGTWPKADIFKALSAFPDLDTLSLYFNLQDSRRWINEKHCISKSVGTIGYCTIRTMRDLLLPRLDTSTAPELWRQVKAHRTARGLPMVRSLFLYSGDYTSDMYGGLPDGFHFETPLPLNISCDKDDLRRVSCRRGRIGIWGMDGEEIMDIPSLFYDASALANRH